MPKCNWRYIAGAFVLIAVVGGSGVWVYHLDKPITEHTSAYKDDAPTEKVPLRLERIASALEAIENGQNSQENEARARRDLDAQEGVWRWAKWAVWVAGVQAVLSFIGIAFVVLTLRQGQSGLSSARRALRHARKANEIASDTAKRQLRAYITASKAFGVWLGEKGKAPQALQVIIELCNSGQTPTRSLSQTLDKKLVPASDVDSDIGFSLTSGKQSPHSSFGSGATFPANFFVSADELETAKSLGHQWVFYIGNEYTDIFGDSHTSEFCVHITRINIPMVMSQEGVVPPEFNVVFKTCALHNRCT